MEELVVGVEEVKVVEGRVVFDGGCFGVGGVGGCGGE